MSWDPIAKIANDVQASTIKAIDLVEQSLAAIEKHKEYQAIITVMAEQARSRAKVIDEKVANGVKVGRLAGVPFIAKDNILVRETEATASSNMLKGFVPPYQSTIVERLEAEGAICVAKANQDAFGHGASTENSDFFVTKNPHDKTRVPGGSSGGPAAAVVLEMAPFAIGTDTGGSIRQPASYVGCVGLRPTYGLTSRSGVVAMASSTDTIGPLTMSVEDAAYVLDVYAGKDELDGTTIDRDPQGYVLPPITRHLPTTKVGIIKEWMGEGLDDDVRKSIEKAAADLRAAGASVEEVSLPSLPLALAVYYILIPAEVSSNLARHDGQRYQFSAESGKNLTESYTHSRAKGFGREAKRRIMIGTYVLSSGYYDAYYKKAQTVRTKLINEFNAVFEKYDFLIGPVAPNAAFKIGENADDPLKMYLVDMMTVAPALVGVPAISIPVQPSGTTGMPIGLQIIAAQRQDRELLAFAAAAEEAIHE
ncbi:Asp-tRNA(Asn)/Glu-tRNA(Gln) amidotransferase subunit GatA [Candidatus Saccharibacteria bacterium]|nr:Asp-tRNA(Asn)/Glu-tRNA(Gln) amidotransferase subunit GatA [Candidatus Saccharibacteria bacterium]